MQRTRLAVLLALAFVGCIDDPDIFIEANPPDVVVNYECPCLEGSCEHVVNITEEVYPTETIYVTEEDTTPDVVQEFYGDTADLPVLLWSGIGAPMPKKLSELTVATVVNPDDQLYLEQAGASKSVTAAIAFVPTNYIGGLITSNGTDADHDVDIAPGIARSLDDTTSLRLAAILTKQIDAVWAEGDDAGGLDAAPVVAADTLYAIWLIKNPTSGTVDALFSLSFTAPTMPTNYTKKRLIGAVMTDGSANLLAYTQVGDYFRYTTPITEFTDTSLVSAVWEDAVLTSIPPNALAYVGVYFSNVGTTGTVITFNIRPKGTSDSGAGNAASLTIGAAGVLAQLGGQAIVLCPSDQTIEYSAVSTDIATESLSLSTHAFTMLTRRDP